MEKIKTKLLDFVENGNVESVHIGLCDNCELIFLPNLDEIFDSWKHFSGDYEYPIQSVNIGISPEWEYNHKRKYEGEQLRLRLSLARHILNEIEKLGI